MNTSLDLAPEHAYRASVDRAHRRAFGQFFTPPNLALLMAHWITANHACRTILDPALGLGMFVRAITAVSCQPFAFHGYDCDPAMLERAADVLHDVPHLTLECADYLTSDWHTRYDGIICNPPYQKFQHYSQRNERLSLIEQQLGMKLSGLTNIYTLFLLKAMRQLAPNGRAAFLCPSEVFHADYGVQIKQYLLDSGMVRAILLCDPRYAIFDDALTTSCIVLLENAPSNQPISSCLMCNDADVADLTMRIKTGQPLPQTAHNPLQAQIQHNHNLVPLNTYGKVMRGIATGANQFFMLNHARRDALGLADHVLPCISKSSHATQPFFTSHDFAHLNDQGKACWLFDAGTAHDPAVQRYVAHGEQQQVHERHLTRHRSPWYALEHREPAPILVGTFFRQRLRFVRNEAGVRTLTCFHSLYLNLAPHDIDLLMAYLLTNTAHEIIGRNRRAYGGGLNKFEPNDLNLALVLDLNALTASQRIDMARLSMLYRQSWLDGAPNESWLALLDGVVASVVDSKQ